MSNRKSIPRDVRRQIYIEALAAGISNKDGLMYGAGDAIYTVISGPEGAPDAHSFKEDSRERKI